MRLAPAVCKLCELGLRLELAEPWSLGLTTVPLVAPGGPDCDRELGDGKPRVSVTGCEPGATLPVPLACELGWLSDGAGLVGAFGDDGVTAISILDCCCPLDDSGT